MSFSLNLPHLKQATVDICKYERNEILLSIGANYAEIRQYETVLKWYKP